MPTIKNKYVRLILRITIPFVAVPLLVLLGEVVFTERKYLAISFGIAALSILLFIAGFEKKSIGTRRMVLTSVMTALSVVGRFIPFFKPITAITVITAIWLGGESGFMVGSFSALLSNFYFGQGPWTPFQMLAWGMLGLIAGFLSPHLRKSRVALLSYGVLSGIAYSFFMDIWTVLAYSDTFDTTLYLSALVTALPHTILYSVSNFIFLLLMGKPFGEKLSRIKIKYGI